MAACWHRAGSLWSGRATAERSRGRKKVSLTFIGVARDGRIDAGAGIDPRELDGAEPHNALERFLHSESPTRSVRAGTK